MFVFAGIAAGHYLWRAPAAPEPKFQRLTFDQGYIWSARFTPDGQSVIYSAAWKGNSLQIFSMRPGAANSRSLGLPSADVLSISSSGEMALSLGRHYTHNWTSAGKLAQVALDEQVPREILDDVLCADGRPTGAPWPRPLRRRTLSSRIPCGFRAIRNQWLDQQRPRFARRRQGRLYGPPASRG
jgi:hypothetical protein